MVHLIDIALEHHDFPKDQIPLFNQLFDELIAAKLKINFKIEFEK